ncbi:MAG: MmgE/PrpD family protein [Loktanella sp.]|jgi:2-methylcitrate dehydratase PrpD|nr:MmgE/PrpD family protein [Loktanella sp.]MDO7608442.1 MmgE/PrpD family protein [Loktanella sp.]MDO7623759.1 MmgE/PrpD family protein [Loktanella sp.]MDO7626955.1 MmgE/PrpD family protein [Loktanella sp.]MDO7631293.1 MmgE/PrpD family protein [Loktanella sp.]
MSIETQLADFAVNSEPSPDALEMMRLSLMDWAACGIAGREEPLAVILRDKGLSEGGKAEASVIGGDKLPAPRAAMINGAVSHALDYDDTHFAHIGHTSVGVIPAALAVAERVGASFDDFLTACLIGSEGAVRVGVWLGRDHYQVGYHQTATAGAFGACLAALRLLGADQAQAIAGIGLVSSKAAGLKAQFGTMAKPLNAGLAAEAGVEAALWAMAGMTSTEQGLQAFGVTHHGDADAAAFDGLGGTWRMLEVSHKFHACCHGLHAMLEALSEVSVDPADVVSVEITTHPRWMTVCNKPAPHTGLEAKFSYAQTAAMALVGVDTSAIAAFSDMVAQRSDLVALRDVVSVVTAESLTEMQARVRITLRDGAVLDAAHDLAAPMALEARAAKLMRKAQGLVPDADALWQVTDLASLAAILRA